MVDIYHISTSDYGGDSLMTSSLGEKFISKKKKKIVDLKNNKTEDELRENWASKTVPPLKGRPHRTLLLDPVEHTQS